MPTIFAVSIKNKLNAHMPGLIFHLLRTTVKGTVRSEQKWHALLKKKKETYHQDTVFNQRVSQSISHT
jgi:hypothetical protein